MEGSAAWRQTAALPSEPANHNFNPHDRWCSHAPLGQECWQIVSQWVWNVRLELGHQLEPEPVRTTEFAPAALPAQEETANSPEPVLGYVEPVVALPWKRGRFSGEDFAREPDGTLRCPAGASLFVQERRRERAGILRLVYAARIGQCRPCPLREQCQWHDSATTKPRRVSVLLHPTSVGAAPLLWRDWSRRQHRRAAMQLVRRQRVDVQLEPAGQTLRVVSPPIFSRAQRAHYRLSHAERLARNARALTAGRVAITLYGVPDPFAAFLGLATA